MSDAANPQAKGKISMDPLSKLEGAFEQHVKNTKNNLDNLYDKARESDLKLGTIDTKMDGLKETMTGLTAAMQPIKDIGAVIRVSKWLAGGIPAVTIIVGGLFWLFKILESIPTVAAGG